MIPVLMTLSDLRPGLQGCSIFGNQLCQKWLAIVTI